MRMKRFLSILLSLVMVLGLVPGMSLTARAEETATVNIYDLTGTLCDTKVFNIGDMFTTYTVFNAADINNGRILNVDGQQTYTDSVLALADELDTDKAIKNKTLVFPILGTDAIGNAGNSGEISFNAISLATNTFNSDDDVLIRTMYTVKAGGVANIRTKIRDMTSADGNHIFEHWEIKADRFTSSITAVENYPLWIGGVQADENNCDKLTNNHWSYNPSTHILTLSGYSYSGTGYNYSGSYYAGIYYNGADALTVSLTGTNSVTQALSWANDGDCAIIIDGSAALTITGTGSLTAQVQDSWGGPAIRSSEAIVFSGGTVKGTGGSAGVKASGVTVKEGITSVDLKGSQDSAKAVDGTLINEMAGVGYNKWNQSTKIEANNTGATLTYQHVVFPIAQYTLRFDANGGSGSMDDVTVEEGESYTLPDCGFDPPTDKKFNWWNVVGMDLIGIPGTPAVIASNCADEDGVVTVKALWIDMDKAPAATVKTAPEAIGNLTYSGQKQALVTAGEAEGGAIWYAIGENETDVPDSGWSKDIPEGTNAGSYYVWYRAAGDNSHRDSDAACCEVKINKAANPATVTGTASVMRGGNTVDLVNNIILNNATGTIGYAISGEAHGCTVSDAGVLTSGTGENAGYTGSVTVNVTVAEDANYFALAATPITVTISDKGTQTITADDVTATYGDTDKSVSATVTDPATGGGAISYAVKEGSGDYIEVNASTGALTIKKVPADGKAYVTVTAAETAAYEHATKDITVTISKANAVPATVTANNRTYDGTEKPLVTVTGEPTGGTMYYALSSDATTAPADNLYTTSIPTKTDAGTYYVWYKAVGDDNHKDTDPAPLTVTISPADKTALNEAIASAEAYYDTIKDKAEYAGVAAALNSAIDAAKAVAANDNVTESAVAQAIKDVNDAVDKAKADVAVIDAINALPNPAGVNDKAAVEAARRAFDALTANQKALVPADAQKKLVAAEEQVRAAEADTTAAQAVINAINALPNPAGVNDKAAVEAARKAFDALTANQKALVPADVQKKLVAAEEQVKAAEEAAKKQAEDQAAVQAVTEAINALPAEEAGLDDKPAVEAARKAYDDLTEAQKKLVPEDVVKKLTTAEEQVKAAEEAAKAIDIAKCKITVKNLTYTGEPVKEPDVTVMDGEKKLAEGTDYTVVWNHKVKSIGAHGLLVSGIGGYTGKQTLTFKIIPQGTEFTELTPDKHRITLKWEKRDNIKRYQIQIGTKKDFSDGQKIVIWSRKTLTRVIRKLESGKTYYVRIRTIAKVKGKNYYSVWSEPEAVTTKSETGNAVAQVVGGESLDLGEGVTLPGIDGMIDVGIIDGIGMDEEIELTLE